MPQFEKRLRACIDQITDEIIIPGSAFRPYDYSILKKVYELRDMEYIVYKSYLQSCLQYFQALSSIGSMCLLL